MDRGTQFAWIDLPIMGEDGWPLEERGIVDSQHGLYFMGLAFQFAFSSMLILGAGQDAAHVADHLDKRMRAVATRMTEVTRGRADPARDGTPPR